nr:hypothetical protein [Paenibacillus psychroresistens]
MLSHNVVMLKVTGTEATGIEMDNSGSGFVTTGTWTASTLQPDTMGLII